MKKIVIEYKDNQFDITVTRWDNEEYTVTKDTPAGVMKVLMTLLEVVIDPVLRDAE